MSIERPRKKNYWRILMPRAPMPTNC